MLLIYSLAIFTGAALLFMVQPMFARMMLPQLGGSPAVWNTAMVFYQAALLAGYAYSHYSIRWLGARRQAILHVALLLTPLAVLPITLQPSLKPPTTTNPIPWIFGVMTLAVGLPFFAVSATSPLLQRWLATTDHPSAKDPYFLYAASNAGSLLALLAYPAMVEPNLDLATQSRLWSYGYIFLIGMLALSAFTLWRSRPAPETEAAANRREEKIESNRKLRWVLLAFVPSSWMLSVTTYLTTDISAIPLLWIIPLTLYLLTFIWVFSKCPPSQSALRYTFCAAVLPIVVLLCATPFLPITWLIATHLTAFFVAALACHGALAKDRPSPRHLTEFFLWMSLGGVLGGAFNALLAPVVFKGVTEYPLIIVLGAFLVMRRPTRKIDTRSAIDEDLQVVFDWALPMVVGAICVGLILWLQYIRNTSTYIVMGIMFGIPCLMTLAFIKRPLRFALALACICLAANLRDRDQYIGLHEDRSFFGIYQVMADSKETYHYLIHGSTLHGTQYLAPDEIRLPKTYYNHAGPFGQTLDALWKLRGPQLRKVGAIGLGTGTSSAYARAGQEWTFYEIDPIIKEIATEPRYFSYLHDCPAKWNIVLGDGRLHMESAPDGKYDLLILDAYSSDSLPIHLLTREALQLYLRKMSPHGVMIFNITNRHLKLEPEMAALAHDLNLVAYSQNYTPSQELTNRGIIGSEWIAVARSDSDLGTVAADNRWHPAQEEEGVRPWTDGYSSVLSVFKWR